MEKTKRWVSRRAAGINAGLVVAGLAIDLFEDSLPSFFTFIDEICWILIALVVFRLTKLTQTLLR